MNMFGHNTQEPGGGQYGRQQAFDVGPSYDRMWSGSSSSPWDTPPPQDYISPPQDYSQPPLWDTDPSDPSCAWDLDLSHKLATKLLLLDSRPEEQREEMFIDPSQGQAPSNPRFKTEICRNFKEKGACVYGGLCQFAHGKHELRQDVVRHTKYKTKLCQKYWIAGYCAYGPRCNFVHQEMEKQYSQEPFPEVTINKPAVIKRAVSGFTRPQQTFPSTLVRNVSDVIRISKIRTGSQGDSGGDSGSDQGGANGGAWPGIMKPPGRQVCMVDRGSALDFPNLVFDNLLPTVNRPIGSERPGAGKRLLWGGGV